MVKIAGIDDTGGYGRDRVRGHFGLIFVCLSMLLSGGAVGQNEARDLDNYSNPDSVVIAIAEVPPAVLKAALDAKPGLYLTHVVRDLEADDDMYYSFEGSLVGSFWIVVVRADGTVIKVREEHDRPRRDSD